MQSNNNNILSLEFNQDNTCLACGTETGFTIFFVSPFQELISRSINTEKENENKKKLN
jgi:hypothetical protein